MTIKYFVVFGLYFILNSTDVKSQWSTDSSLNTKISNFGINPQSVTDSKGGIITVFSNTVKNKVYIQRNNKFGDIVWNNGNPIAVGGVLQSQSLITIVDDKNSGAYVLFTETNRIAASDTHSVFVYLNRIDSNGVWRINDQNGIKLNITLNNPSKPLKYYDKLFARLITDNSGSVFYAWVDTLTTFDSVINVVNIQKIDGTGNFKFGPNGISVTTNIPFSEIIDMSTDYHNGIMISTYSHIQRVNNEGQKSFGDNGLSIQPGSHSIRTINNTEIFFSLYSSADSLVLNCYSYTGELKWSKVMFDTLQLKNKVELSKISENEFILVALYSDQNNYKISLDRFDSVGKSIAPIIELVNVPHVILDFRLELVDSTSFFIAWSFKNSLFYYKFSINKYSNIGSSLWASSKTIASNETPQGFLQTKSSDLSGVIFIWYELALRQGIYAQQINSDGFYGVMTNVEKNYQIHVNKLNFELSNNYPNPFNPSTSISYQITVSGMVSLKVYDMLGREVTTLVNEMHSAGTYSVRFDAGSLSSGMYLYTLCSGSNVSTKRLMLIK